MKSFNIEGHDCMVSVSNAGNKTEVFEVYTFYKPIRNWVQLSCAATEEEAKADAQSVLSDRLKLGCALMAEAHRMFGALEWAKENLRKFNRGVPVGDDLPLQG